MNRILIDTNILVYAYDQRAPNKQRRAIEVLNRVREARSGVVTAQVLSEFYIASTRKLKPPLTPPQAEAQLHAFAAQWPVLPISETVVLLAACRTQDYHMHFWDAQIWASARLHGIPIIYSEDFNPGAVIEDVRFVNPLVEDA